VNSWSSSPKQNLLTFSPSEDESEIQRTNESSLKQSRSGNM
jgi:hypothetical protein